MNQTPEKIWEAGECLWGQQGLKTSGKQGITLQDQLNGHEFEKTPGDSEGQRSLACCSPWGCKESA